MNYLPLILLASSPFFKDFAAKPVWHLVLSFQCPQGEGIFFGNDFYWRMFAIKIAHVAQLACKWRKFRALPKNT